jgi:adenosylhomocysteine nucleosidase
MKIALLAPMRSELRPLVTRLSLRRSPPPPAARGGRSYDGRAGTATVTATLTGIGTAAAARAAHRVLDSGPVDHVVVVGIAGGIDDGLAIGDLVVPRAVVDGRTGTAYRPHPLGEPPPAGARVSDGVLHTSDDLLVDPDAVGALAAQGVVALDMETAAIAAVCEDRDCPWSVFRAISDRSCDGMVDAAVAGLARPDGSPDLAAVARFVVWHPARVRDLVRLGRDARVAAHAAAAAAARACSHAAVQRPGP